MEAVRIKIWKKKQPNKPSVDFERILRDIHAGTTSNLREGFESGIKRINHQHDGSIPPTYCRVVVFIHNGSVNEGIRDTNMIGATSQLVDLIDFNNEEVFFGSIFTSESTTEQASAFNEELWTTSSPTSDGTVFVSVMDRQLLNEVKEVGAILVTYRDFHSLDSDAYTPGLNQDIVKLEGNESMERLRTFMMFWIANEKLKEAAVEAEKGNVRKAKEMAQEAQQTVHAFVASRLLSK
ncbi:hypothetical protein BLNAU_5625 [Blattamonas nauphoetae]|uniref:Uncharacterized protein n=1 Tax=Blattamonas nauphoetae TaxID=2049346 RepID=A0ABQ9Y6G3_9EUKA|nr:hypothetical protein BLNAU_5625 [Blattamonas nauphoetae]